MAILNDIVVSLPDTVAISTTLENLLIHPQSAPTSGEDVWIVVIIGIIIIAALWIVGHYICKSLISANRTKIEELLTRQQHELLKMKEEAAIKVAANRFNAEQTEKQRQWISEADSIKNDAERNKLRLTIAEINDKISKLEKSAEEVREEKRISLDLQKLDFRLKAAQTDAEIKSLENNKETSADSQTKS